MLYRTPRLSIAALLRALLARMAGALAEFHKTGVDTAYLDGLNAHELRDLGLERTDERGETVYR